MKTNFAVMLISSVVLTVAWWARQASLITTSPHGRYYVTAAMMISGILLVITLSRMIRIQRNRPSSPDPTNRDSSERRRLEYRIRFAESSYPIFVQSNENHPSAPEYTCPVYDISATGISLNCTRVYKLGEAVQGQIIFESGRTAPVNGIVVREERQRSCLRLHCTIDPALLMAEQRKQITVKKAAGPRPAVSKTVLDAVPDSLPSHAPKGICRIKRP